MKLAQEMWALTPALRQQYGGEWGRFWARQDRTIEHVINGDYDKLKDHQLHDGFSAFLTKNYPNALSRADRRSAIQLSHFVEPLTWFFGRTPRDSEQQDVEVPALGVMELQVKDAPERSWNHYRLAWRASQSGSQWSGAVLFSSIDGTVRYEGFLLAKQGIALLRDVRDHRAFAVLLIAFGMPDAGGYFYRQLHGPLSLVAGTLFPCKDKETGQAATAFLNSVDNMKIDIYQ